MIQMTGNRNTDTMIHVWIGSYETTLIQVQTVHVQNHPSQKRHPNIYQGVGNINLQFES